MHTRDIEIHEPFLRRLATSLVRDEHTAEDLVQDTWLRALDQTPRDARSLLARIARNLASNRHKREARRGARERAAARQESVSGFGVDDDLGLLGDVVASVQELAEPFRTAIYLRYYRDLTPTRIARELGVPLPTVKSRLVRAKQLIRSSLDKRRDGRSAWRGPLAAFVGIDNLTTTTAGAFLLTNYTKIALVGALSLGLVTWWSWPTDVPNEKDGSTVLVATEDEPVALRADERMPLEHPAARTVTHGNAPAPKAPRVVEEPDGPIVAQVFYTTGQPAIGVRIGFHDRPSEGRTGEITALTDAVGRARLVGARGQGLIKAIDDRLATVLYGYVAPSQRSVPSVVVVATRHPIAGKVVDRAGRGLAHASIEIELPPGFRSRFPIRMDRSRRAKLGTTSAEGGEFSLPQIGNIGDATIVVRLPGYNEGRYPLPARPDLNVVLELDRADLETATGVVVDHAGVPVPGARVSSGAEVVHTNATGQFQLPLDTKSAAARERVRWLGTDDAPRRITALAAGFLPGFVEVERGNAWPTPITIRLGEPAKRIRGRVVDAEGHPVSAQVWIDNPTMFTTRNNVQTIEGALAGRPNQRLLSTRTNAAGKFELQGLLEKPYRIGAADARTMLHAYADEVRPGDDVTIRLDDRGLVQRVSGNVVGHDGNAIADVSIRVLMRVNRIEHEGRVLRTSTLSRAPVRVDRDGRFEIRDLPPRGIDLFVEGPEIFRRRFRGHELDLAKDLRLAVPRKIRIQVVLADPSEGDRFRVFAVRGERRLLYELAFKGAKGASEARLAAGRSEVLAVHDDVRDVVLFAGEREVRRKVVTLQTGRPNIIRF